MVVFVYQGYRDTIDTFHGKFDTLEAAENHIYQDLVKEVQEFLDTMEQKKNGTYVSEQTKLLKQVNDQVIKRMGKEHYETSLKDAEKRDAEITEHALESLKYYENTDWKGEFKKVSQTPKPSIQQYPSKKMYEGYSQRYAQSQGNYPYIVFDPSFVPSSKEMNAEGKEYTLLDGIREEFDVEFNEWADQERMSHGKDISFKDWAQDEGMKHGNTEITEWAQHEDESHDARYGAEQPIRMSQEDLLDFFNSLKTNEEILVWYNSAVRSADDWIKMTVGRRSESKKYGVKKVALKGKNGGKFYLYNRKGRISLAMGDMATSLIAAKKSDAKGYGAEDGNEKSIKSAIKKLEKALSKTDGAKYKMHDLDISVQPTTIAGFEMSRNGKKYDGGSYLIMKDGSIINAAMGNAEYGNITDNFEVMKEKIMQSFGSESRITRYGMIAAGVIAAFAILPEIKKRF